MSRLVCIVLLALLLVVSAVAAHRIPCHNGNTNSLRMQDGKLSYSCGCPRGKQTYFELCLSWKEIFDELVFSWVDPPRLPNTCTWVQHRRLLRYRALCHGYKNFEHIFLDYSPALQEEILYDLQRFQHIPFDFSDRHPQKECRFLSTYTDDSPFDENPRQRFDAFPAWKHRNNPELGVVIHDDAQGAHKRYVNLEEEHNANRPHHHERLV